MNRKLLASTGIIIVLLGYIFFSGRKGPEDVPDIKPWSGDATYLVMQKGTNPCSSGRLTGSGSSMRKNIRRTRTW